MGGYWNRSTVLEPDVIPVPPVRKSIHEVATGEALRYKWIESEKAGRDLGGSAIRSWAREHWNRFVRQCWIEHLEGRVFWIELDHGDFALLERETLDSVLLDEILVRIQRGGENLDILCWSHARQLSNDELKKILGFLERLDINGHRVPCEIDPRLLQAG